MSRNLAKILHFVILVVGVLLFSLFLAKQMKVVAYLCVAATLAGTAYTSHRLRCPHCGRWPGKHDLFDRYCSRCGGYLDE